MSINRVSLALLGLVVAGVALGLRSLEEARASIAHWIDEYNHDRPHRGVQNRTPHEAFLAFAGVLKNEALTV
jgi:hypothetical protein